MTADRNTLGSVNKALDVLEAFSDARPEWGLSELSRELEIGKPTLHRLLKNLEQRGYVRQDSETRRYRLGMRLWEVGSLAIRGSTPKNAAHPWLRHIAERTGEQATLWVYDDGNVVCVDKWEGASRVRTHTELGAREPSWLLASGRCLLAHRPGQEVTRVSRRAQRDGVQPQQLRARLADVRARGYELSRGDRWPEVYAVAAPVFDHRGDAVAALAVSAASTRFDSQFEAQVVATVLRVTQRVSHDLGAPSGDQLTM